MLATLLLIVAQQQPVALTEREVRFIARMSPLPPPPASPTNRWADDSAAAELGRKLFFDAGLSKSGAIACSSCHSPQSAWCDAKPTAAGAMAGSKNTPTILNAAHQRWLFWNGRADSLWSQALKPIESDGEMASSRTAVLRHIAGDAALSALWGSVFGNMDVSLETLAQDAKPAPIDPNHPYEPSMSTQPEHQAWLAIAATERMRIDSLYSKVGKAIEAFERTITSGPSALDRFVAGVRGDDAGDVGALSETAVRGLRLFVGKANCVACHSGPTFSDGQFHNLGLESQTLELGRPDGIRELRVDPFNGRGRSSDDADWGANQKLLYLPSDEHVVGAYKTPSLRNVSRTAPYMHDGRFADLEQVLRFYSELPGQPPVGHREETLKPLDLSEAEMADLGEFLAAL